MASWLAGCVSAMSRCLEERLALLEFASAAFRFLPFCTFAFLPFGAIYSMMHCHRLA